MADQYHPKLNEFQLEANEEKVVALALTTEDPWGWDPGGEQKKALKSVKDKIRKYHLERHSQCCCYCQVNLYGGGMMVDREHILPKGKKIYRSLSYTMWNLSVACKRCNMQYKKSNVDFVVVPDDDMKFQSSENYLFIHPNFDLYTEHLKRISAQSGSDVVVIYLIVNDSEKGAFTYQYFNLEGLQTEVGVQSQGRQKKEVLSDIAQEISILRKQFGQ